MLSHENDLKVSGAVFAQVRFPRGVFEMSLNKIMRKLLAFNLFAGVVAALLVLILESKGDGRTQVFFIFMYVIAFPITFWKVYVGIGKEITEDAVRGMLKVKTAIALFLVCTIFLCVFPFLITAETHLPEGRSGWFIMTMQSSLIALWMFGAVLTFSAAALLGVNAAIIKAIISK